MFDFWWDDRRGDWRLWPEAEGALSGGVVVCGSWMLRLCGVMTTLTAAGQHALVVGEQGAGRSTLMKYFISKYDNWRRFNIFL